MSLKPFCVLTLVSLAVLVTPVALSAQDAGQDASGQIKVQRVISPGGIEAWLVEEHSIPIISFDFAFKGGAFLDRPGKEGTANLISALLDEGAGAYDSQTFRSLIEENSISLSFGASRDSLTGSLQTLTANKELAFDLTRLALTQPRFDREPVERIRGQVLVGIKRSEMNPNSIAAKELFNRLFPDDPYGRPTEGTAQSVASISARDLKDFHSAALSRDRLKVGVVGDITAAELGALLDEVFGALPAVGEPLNMGIVEAASTGGNLVIDMKNPQSTVIFAGPSIGREDPDFIPTYVLNYTLGGGGFSSRLLHEVREKRGLTYSIYTYSLPFDRSAIWVGQVASDNAKIAETLQVVRDEITKMREAGLTAEELEDAKRYLTGAFPLRFSSNTSIANQLLGYQMSGYGIDYINERNDKIEAVTLEDVRRAAQRLPSPDEITFVIVGEPEGIE
ncbi:MAG: insulinase family protein [Alphaproteobacteria bacterium]|nr:MAG: insulinase family protein [Alphaproteobacteria bacterium]